MAEPLELRWLERAPEPAPEFTLADDPRLRHDVINALTAVTTAAQLLDHRWDDLREEQRRELVTTLRTRVEQLRTFLQP